MSRPTDRAAVPGRELGPRRTGQALVEFALILPILLALIFAIMDFGYYLFVSISVNHATRAGVRKAAMNNLTGCQIMDVVKNSAVGVALNNSQININPVANDPSLPNSPPTVTVTTEFTHQMLVSSLYNVNSIKVKSSYKSIVTTYTGKTSITFTGSCP